MRTPPPSVTVEGEAFVAMGSLLRFHRIMVDSIESELKRHRLNVTEYMILMTLQLSESGTRLISSIARNLLVHPTTATLAIDRLEARKLLHRSPHPTDRRATMVSITRAGRTTTRAASVSLGLIEYGLIGTSPAERAELTAVLARLRAAAGDEH